MHVLSKCLDRPCSYLESLALQFNKRCLQLVKLLIYLFIHFSMETFVVGIHQKNPIISNHNIWFHGLFVCVEVLRPSQPNGVMSSAVSLPNHTFTGQA